MVTITDITAMRIWAHEGLLNRVGSPLSGKGLDWTLESVRELRECGLEQLGITLSESDPVHVLVDSAERRARSRVVRSHVWSGRIPAGSFYRIAPGILIASPAFCCLQAAATGSLPYVASVEMECLGLYGRVDDSRGFLDRRPLLSISELEEYLLSARPCRGARSALEALKRCLYPSRSPLETRTALVLTLPRNMGGYGLPRPEMNCVVRPLPEEVPYSQFASYEIDVCWPQRRVAIEVDSYRYHSSRARHNTDAMKRNSLKSMGWKVTSVTDGQLSGDALDVLARQLAKDLAVKSAEPPAGLRDWLLDQIP